MGRRDKGDEWRKRGREEGERGKDEWKGIKELKVRGGSQYFFNAGGKIFCSNLSGAPP